MKLCEKCGGLIATEPNEMIAGTPCICGRIESENKKLQELFDKAMERKTLTGGIYGWICPRCQSVHSPFVQSCCCNAPTTTTAGANAA